MPLSPSKIRARIAQLGITQAEAARRAGLDRQNFNRLLRQKSPDPKLSTAERIAGALECAVDRLIG